MAGEKKRHMIKLRGNAKKKALNNEMEKFLLKLKCVQGKAEVNIGKTT